MNKFHKFIFIFCFLSVVSCKLPFPTQNVPYVPKFKSVLYQSYTGKSSENARSAFAIQNRNIEFEYGIVDIDSLIEVIVMISTGFNEGRIEPGLVAVFDDSTEIAFITIPINSVEYAETKNSTSNEYVKSEQTIREPAKNTEVTQSDGKTVTVTIPAVTKTIETTQAIPVNTQTVDNKIFNQFEFVITGDDLRKFKASKMDYFIAYFRKGDIKINVGNFAKLDIIKHLNQTQP